MRQLAEELTSTENRVARAAALQRCGADYNTARQSSRPAAAGAFGHDGPPRCAASSLASPPSRAWGATRSFEQPGRRAGAWLLALLFTLGVWARSRVAQRSVHPDRGQPRPPAPDAPARSRSWAWPCRRRDRRQGMEVEPAPRRWRIPGSSAAGTCTAATRTRTAATCSTWSRRCRWPRRARAGRSPPPDEDAINAFAAGHPTRCWASRRRGKRLNRGSRRAWWPTSSATS